jgi:hypothetical protein
LRVCTPVRTMRLYTPQYDRLLTIYLGENNLSFIETSALDASNVELAFQNILTGTFPHTATTHTATPWHGRILRQNWTAVCFERLSTPPLPSTTPLTKRSCVTSQELD